MTHTQIPDNTPSSDMLAAMELVKKMQAAADRNGIRFIGGFTAPDGTKFITSNMDESDPHYQVPENLQD